MGASETHSMMIPEAVVDNLQACFIIVEKKIFFNSIMSLITFTFAASGWLG